VLLDGHGWRVADELPSSDDCGWKDLPRLIYPTGGDNCVGDQLPCTGDGWKAFPGKLLSPGGDGCISDTLSRTSDPRSR
jgi:hypothetical protein